MATDDGPRHVTEDRGMRIEWDVPVPMDDGVVLRADVFRPVDEAVLVPAIVSYGAYAKGLAFQEGYPDQWEQMVRDRPDIAAGSSNAYQSWEVVDPEKWVPDGYACVRVDARGSGRSPGHLEPWSPRETWDVYHCVEWAAAQGWCSGRVGMAGISYFAMNQWDVAPLAPPHLAAIIPWEGSADSYRELYAHGGIPSAFARRWYRKQVLTVQHGLGERAPVNPNTGMGVAGDETLGEGELAQRRADFDALWGAHRLADDFHAARTPEFSAITVPLLSCASWGGQGLHPRGNFEGFTQSASEHKWLEVHGLEHWTHFYTDYGVGLQKRFFAHFLKGEDNGWEREPRVQLNVRHPGERFEWRGEDEWPLARTRWTKHFLDLEAGAIGPDRLPERPQQASYDALGEGIELSTPPLSEPTEVTGPLAAKLWVSSSTRDADLFLVVRVYDPDDAEVVFAGTVDPHTPVAQGWLRASHRRLDPERSLPYRPWHPHDRVEWLTPGEVYELDIEIWPTCIVIPAGYRLALQIRGKDYTYPGEPARISTFDKPLTGCGPFLHDDPDDRPEDLYGGQVTIHTDPERPSYLLVPIIPEA